MRIVLAIILLTACSSASTGDDFCNRANSCNFLVTSVEECVNSVDTALNGLSDSDREDVESQLQRCIDRPSCSQFASCILGLQSAKAGGARPRASDLLEIE